MFWPGNGLIQGKGTHKYDGGKEKCARAEPILQLAGKGFHEGRKNVKSVERWQTVRTRYDQLHEKKEKGKKSIFTSSSALKTYYLISASKNESRMKRMQQYTIYLAHKPDIYCYVHRRRICATFFSSPSPSSPYFLFTPSRPSSLFLHASMARWREKRLKARLC